MEKIICLLPKSPLPKRGRIGPEKWQNWYRGVQKSLKLFFKLTSKHLDSQIIIPSIFREPNKSILEANFYSDLLIKKGLIQNIDVIPFYNGNETISQIETASQYANTRNCDLIIVWACPEHAARWLLIKSWLNIPDSLKISHRVSLFGIPRPKEFIMDVVILPVLVVVKLINSFFPGAEERFKNRILSSVKKRREKGKI